MTLDGVGLHFSHFIYSLFENRMTVAESRMIPRWRGHCLCCMPLFGLLTFFFRIFPSSYGIQEEVNYLKYDHHAWNKNKMMLITVDECFPYPLQFTPVELFRNIHFYLIKILNTFVLFFSDRWCLRLMCVSIYAFPRIIAPSPYNLVLFCFCFF